DELLRGEWTFAAVLLEPVMRDQLDDVPGRVVEVEGERVPVVEVPDVAEHLDPVTRPRERRVEAVARHEQGEVVERLALGRLEAQCRLADANRAVRDW